MTLTSRLSASFLGVLALVLAGFSTALYVLASVQLYRAVDDRIESALATLTALAEEEGGGLEWEPNDRRVIPGKDPGREQVRWAVSDTRGKRLDR